MANDHRQSVDSASNRTASERVPASTLSRRLFWLLGALGLVAVWAYWPSLGDVFAAWLSDPDYTHGFFVVPVSVWLLWARRNQMPTTSTPSWVGLLLLLAAGLIRIAAGRFYLPQLDAWSIPLWVGGVVWLLFGWSMLKWALPSIAFLWFATPLPGTIETVLSTPLQFLASNFGAFVLRVIGQPALAEGTTILLDDHVLDVERACSGLRMFYGIFALAFGCIALARPTRWKAVFVLMAAVPVAVVANIVRIVATGLLMRYTSGEAAQKFSHDLAGLVMIPFAVGLFILFLVVMGRVSRRFEAPGGVAWLTKWGLGFVVLIACAFFWGRHQEAQAITTLVDTASRYETEKNWPKSIHFLSRYIRSRPDDYDTFSHLAELYQEHAVSYEDQIRAVELLRTAWQQQPEREDLALAAIQLALQLGDHKNTISLCDELLSQTRKADTRNAATKLRAEALLAYLQSDVNRGDYTWDDVKNAFEKSLKLPDYDAVHASILADIYRQRVRSLSKEDREKRADALMDRLVAEHANDPMAWLARCQYRLRYSGQRKDEIANADKDLDRALALAEKDSSKPEALNVFLTAAARANDRNDSQNAVNLLERAIKVAPADYRAYVMLAEIHRRSGTPDARREAIRVLRDGAKQSKQPEWALILPFASLLAENRDYIEAEAQIAPIERLVPSITGRERAIIKLGLGLIRGQITASREGPEAAITNLRNLLNESDIRLVEPYVRPTMAQGFGILAQLYSSVGDYDLAFDAYRQAARIEPGKPQWEIQSAALALQMGDLDSADSNYQGLAQKGMLTGDTQTGRVEIEIQRQLQQLPDHRDWRTAKQLLQAARQTGLSELPVGLLAAKILAASGEMDKSEQFLQKLAEKFPTEASVWRSLAVVELQKGDAVRALAAADHFKALTKQGADAASLRAAVLVETKHPDEGIKELSEFVASAPSDQLPKAALTLNHFLNQLGRRPEAIVALERAHEKVPRNLQLIDALATMALSDRDWKNLEKYESWLCTAEGDNGTLWKSFRAQRLLATTNSVDEKDFQEVVSLVDTIVRERPRWSKAHFLQGEVDLRTNKIDEATAAYGRAWQFGVHGAMLADRLIDLSARQGHLEDARRYVAQVHDALRHFPGLVRSRDALSSWRRQQRDGSIGQGWIDQNPKDPDARLRMGRVLLMLADSAPPDKKPQYLARAKSEFKRAIESAPNDVRPWSASVLLYAGSKDTADQALTVLEELAKQSSIDELQRYFALARLYDYLGQTTKAQQFYRQAATVAQAKPKDASADEVLGKTAQFFLQRAPMLAEFYARRALAQNVANKDARIVLVSLLANRADTESLAEATRILNEDATKKSIDPATQSRFRALLLARQGKPEDREVAIKSLQQIVSPSREDKLLLSRLYEQSGQIEPAFELLQQLARSPDAQPAEMTEFLRFWQVHFAANAKSPSSTQFAGQAKDIYQRLGELPGQLTERLRWQLRELRRAIRSENQPPRTAWRMFLRCWPRLPDGN